MRRHIGGGFDPMKLDTEKITRYLLEIRARRLDLGKLLDDHTDAGLLGDTWKLKGLKYTLVELAEAMANTLQHILAKDMGEPVTGYVETIIRAGEKRILPVQLAVKLKPFFDFRNSLIHRYWVIADEKLLALTRENIGDFDDFIQAVESYVKQRRPV
jgi:uncharacterized protein YutE (UPF0331/DUF86 family)